MGTILTPVCNNCKYEGEMLFVGSGMNKASLLGEILKFPGINKRTKKVELDNLPSPKKSPDTFTFYDQPGMSKPKKENNTLDISGHILEKENNLCPKCHEYELDFLITGMWD